MASSDVRHNNALKLAAHGREQIRLGERRSLARSFGGQPRGRTRGRGPEDLAWGRGRGIIGHADVHA